MFFPSEGIKTNGNENAMKPRVWECGRMRADAERGEWAAAVASSCPAACPESEQAKETHCTHAHTRGSKYSEAQL